MRQIDRVLLVTSLLLVTGVLLACAPVTRFGAGATSAATEEMVFGSAGAPAGAAGVDAAQIQELLTAHNRWRAEVGVPALTWSDAVAATSQEWANDLAARGVLEHASSAYGENLSMSSGAQTPTEAVDSWGSEKAECNYNNEPVGETTCTVGHYTQMVWRNSTELGCGVGKTADGATYWVCRYNPPGNMTGETPY